MCGLAGIFYQNSISSRDIDAVKKMCAKIKHRGPDDEGYFQDKNCALGHRRLSIIDLSSAGRQPFVSDDNRYYLVYNGEIYNYIELRNDLKQLGWHFQTNTDTEVLLKAYQQYGNECLKLFNGMFAFVIYDSQEESLFMARDRMGIKPLYYCTIDSYFYFASEIKAFLAVPNFKRSINKQSLFDFLVFNRTDIFDETFFSDVKRFPKGAYAYLNNSGLQISQWWNPNDYLDKLDKITTEKVATTIRDLMVSATLLRMRSDVPVGSCLSGGLDSSILVGILFNHHKLENGYPCFTASFPGKAIDETEYIDRLNTIYPFNNYRTYPTAQIAYENLWEFIYANDEPTTNPSFFSQYEVMRLAKEKGVTVLIDGQGGDENFAGYQYFHGFYWYGLLKRMKPLALGHEILSSLLRKQHFSAYQTFLFQILPSHQKKKLLLRATPLLKKDFFYDLVPKSLIFSDFFRNDGLNSSIARHFQYKLEHLLRMEDRNSMAFSLEARVPYLDFRLVEYVLGIPEILKIKKGGTKHLQKISLHQYTVPEIINRTDKIGFGTPGEDWMSTEEWKELTRKNFHFLVDNFPDIIEKNSSIPNNPIEKWKINQLALWSDIFTVN